ncbi:hypothetical protein HELRODRAFT_184671, partial [Helobdella robusta]|uniref:Uncharacterized protein n=1 Tax=Helobdella robusta TaxID=6412 RepID=T1FLQ8_HELRO
QDTTVKNLGNEYNYSDFTEKDDSIYQTVTFERKSRRRSDNFLHSKKASSRRSSSHVDHRIYRKETFEQQQERLKRQMKIQKKLEKQSEKRRSLRVTELFNENVVKRLTSGRNNNEKNKETQNKKKLSKSEQGDKNGIQNSSLPPCHRRSKNFWNRETQSPFRMLGLYSYEQENDLLQQNGNESFLKSNKNSSNQENKLLKELEHNQTSCDAETDDVKSSKIHICAGGDDACNKYGSGNKLKKYFSNFEKFFRK